MYPTSCSIDPKSLGKLIDGGYRLCFAYAVNGQYNVVAKASGKVFINFEDASEQTQAQCSHHTH